MDNKEYIKECFDLTENRFEEPKKCVGYCASCGAPLSAEGTQLCPKCQKEANGDDKTIFSNQQD